MSGPRLLATIHDTGPGPADPYSGLVQTPHHLHGHGDANDGCGYGVWAVHQMCDEATQHTDDTGFRLRLSAGPR